MTNVVIFGATSAIAEEIAKCYASKGSNLLLFARDEDKLQLIANDLNVRGASSVEIRYFSALDYASHNEQVERAFTTFKRVDVCVIAYGSLPDQAVCEQNVAITIKEVEVNGVSVVSLLSILRTSLSNKGGGVWLLFRALLVIAVGSLIMCMVQLKRWCQPSFKDYPNV